MRSKRSIILFILAGILAVASVLIMQSVQSGTDPEPWTRLHRGMTKKEVVTLLGEPISRRGPSTTTVFGLSFTHKEFWEYGGSWFQLFGPSDDAYVVYFSPDGKVASLRRPKRKKEDVKTSIPLPNQDARAKADSCHDSCWRRSRANCRRGSSLT